MKTYRVQFTKPNPDHLVRSWINVRASNPEEAAIQVLKQNKVILARYVGKTCIAHVADPHHPKHPNGMPMVTHGFMIQIGGA